MTQILTLSGSIRRGSYNQQLADLMSTLLRDAGADVKEINLGDFAMPIFNEDIEKADGTPEAAMDLAKLFAEADAIFIATPEYNGSLPPLLSNTIAWLSRTKLRPFAHATIGLGAVSGGPISGMLSLSHLRDVMMKTQSLLAPTTLSVGFADKAFDESGGLTHATPKKRAEALANELMTLRR